MRKYIRYLLISILLLMSTTVIAEQVEITVKITDQEVNFNRLHNNQPVGQPYIDKNRTYVPIRVLSEDLGYIVDWNQDTSTATITKGAKTVKITIGESTALVNGKRVAIDIQNGKAVDTKAVMKNSRTYVPVRFISEAMGDKVEYRVPGTSDVKLLTVYINCTDLPVEGPAKPVTPPVVKPPVSQTGLVPNFVVVPHNLTGFNDFDVFFENFQEYKGKMSKASIALVSHPHLNKFKVKDPYTGKFNTILNQNDATANKIPNYNTTMFRLVMWHMDSDFKDINTGKPLIQPKVGEIMTMRVTIDMISGPSEVYELKIPYRGFTEVMYTNGTRIK